MKTRITIIVVLLISQIVIGQEKKQKLDNRVNLVTGANQLLLFNGFNIEANLYYNRFAFDYSHGFSLDFSNDALSGAEAEQGIAVHMPYSTGFGMGYRFTEWFNIRVEPKFHKFEIYYDGETQTGENLIGDYKTFSLGLGAYFNWRPFENSETLLKGIVIAPSVRYWPKVGESLDGGSFDYENKITGQSETHQALEVGINNTPFIVNVSLGYSIEF